MSLAINEINNHLNWDDNQAQQEIPWLELMAKLKYDEYRDFLAGARFFERLAAWLGQFDSVEDKQTAYDLVKTRLVFVSAAEINRLVQQFYHKHVFHFLLDKTAEQCGAPSYLVMANPKTLEAFKRLRRRTLFMGLSDGARIDMLRRANVGRLNNEQIVMQPFLDKKNGPIYPMNSKMILLLKAMIILDLS